jgi:hypothetical protein
VLQPRPRRLTRLGLLRPIDRATGKALWDRHPSDTKADHPEIPGASTLPSSERRTSEVASGFATLASLQVGVEAKASGSILSRAIEHDKHHHRVDAGRSSALTIRHLGQIRPGYGRPLKCG